LKLRRDPDCPVCGDHPTVHELIDYEQFCGIAQPAVVAAATGALPADLEATVEELKAIQTSGKPFYLLDVREPHEFQICRIPGATLIPLGQLPSRLNELPTGAGAPEIIVQCRSGVRSAKAVRQLQEHGIKSRNLKGGILAWIDRIDPTLPKY
jgi:adenylyltransferase/sulfurtransferase